MRLFICSASFFTIAVEMSGISTIESEPTRVTGIKSNGIVIPIAIP